MKRIILAAAALVFLAAITLIACSKTSGSTAGSTSSTDSTTSSSSDSATACSSSAVATVLTKITAFKALLSTTQLSTFQLSYTEANAIKWSNLPCGSSCRNGLQLGSLSTAQVTAALEIVQAATGTATDQGYSEFTQIRAADDILAATSGSSAYSSGLYFIAVLGTPSSTGTWQLQYGGHHLALNITFKNGAVAGGSPMFQGIEPKSWTTNATTYTPLAAEHDAMATMLAALTSTELASAKLSTTFSDVLLGPNMDGQFPSTKLGLTVSNLTSAQQALVLTAMKPWVQDLDAETAACLLTTYQNELSKTYIAYSGNAGLTTNADYVRIDGPSVWIEFVCQTGVVYPSQIHYHSIYRDHTRDYGGSW